MDKLQRNRNSMSYNLSYLWATLQKPNPLARPYLSHGPITINLSSETEIKKATPYTQNSNELKNVFMSSSLDSVVYYLSHFSGESTHISEPWYAMHFKIKL